MTPTIIKNRLKTNRKESEKVEDNFLTATEELIKITAERLTELTKEDKEYISPYEELSALAELITARANHTKYVMAFSSSRDLR